MNKSDKNWLINKIDSLESIAVNCDAKNEGSSALYLRTFIKQIVIRCNKTDKFPTYV